MNEYDTMYDEYDSLQDDEIDLLKLVSTDANDLNQYLVFVGSNGEYFAINVSKVEELMVYDESVEIAKNNEEGAIIHGTADIRDAMTTLVYFDDWYNNPRLDDSEYELIVLTNYGGHKLGIIVKEVLNIITIPASTMVSNAQNNPKTTFVSKVTIAKEEHICTIFDGDKMLLDIFDTISLESEMHLSKQVCHSLESKTVYYADDSKFIRMLVERLFKKLKLNYRIFEDGSDMIEEVFADPDADIDLFITDLEMPHMGGREVIASLKNIPKFKQTPILVHTNMSNSVMEHELRQVGAYAVIGKINVDTLGHSMCEAIST